MDKDPKEEIKIDTEDTCVKWVCIKQELDEELYHTQNTNDIKYEGIKEENLNEVHELIHLDKEEMKKDQCYLSQLVLDGRDNIHDNKEIQIKFDKAIYNVSANNDLLADCKNCTKEYCSKCSSLSHFLNNGVPLTESEWIVKTIPTGILEIRYTTSGNGVFALKTLPENVIFGPFEGLPAIETKDGYMWNIKYKKLVNEKCGNWMQYVSCANNSLFKNLDIFQFEGHLYFQTTREIGEGEELFVYYNDEDIQKSDINEDNYYIPISEQKSQNIFACFLCCLGFNSEKCLIIHKTKCPYFLYNVNIIEIIQCFCCQIFLEKQEHVNHHADYCLKNYSRIYNYPAGIERSTTHVPMHTAETDKIDRKIDELSHKLHTNDSNIIETEKKINCLQCTYETNSEYHFQIHLNTHRIDNNVQCNICGNTYKNKICLQRHIRCKHTEKQLENNIKRFQCDICMKLFKKKTSIQRHKRDIHTENIEKQLQCTQCNYKTNYATNLLRHLNTHNDVKPFHCDLCKQSFTQKGHLKAHVKSKHMPEAPKNYKCTECIFQTDYNTSFLRHLDKHRNIKRYRCDICNMNFYHQNSLKMHIKKKHTDNKDFKCTKCSLQPNHQGDVKEFHCEHKKPIIKKKKTKDFNCNQCSFVTNYKESLHRHLTTHSDIKPYECYICSLTFKSKITLKLHIKDKHMHGLSKLYKCPQCSYETNFKDRFRRHCNTHTNEKPFQCNFCTRKFNAKSNLKRHVRDKHTDGAVKEYKCTFTKCLYETYYKGDLQRHLNAHKKNVIKPFHCDVCKIRFAKIRTFQKHMKNKHSGKKFN